MSTKKATKRKATKKGQPKAAVKESASTRAANGKAAVAKGRKFEDEVADLYRLLGAEVVQGIEICQKKVDILATFSIQGSPIKHRILVECKDEKKAVDANQRVMQFQGLLDVARKAGEADSAEIVTRSAWGDAAKGFALKAGISLLTYSEKISQLINFTHYLKDLIGRFEHGEPGRPSLPPLADYYVDLSAERQSCGASEKIPKVDDFIYQWLSKNSSKHLAIFGEYGAGKSSLCQKLTHDLAKMFLTDSNRGRIPILLNLREFIGKIKLEAFITSFLDQECMVTNPRYDLFKAMNDAGMFLLIFDGFDEMAVKVDEDVIEANLTEIEKLAAAPNSKVLLTSRPEYFISIDEESQALNPELNMFGTRMAQYEPLKILPWDEGQVEKFLERRVPKVKEARHPWTYYRDKIKKIPSLGDLSQRPVLLEMIVKSLPRMIEGGMTINLPNLYKAYLTGEIKRQKIAKKRELLLTEKSRFLVLQQLATDLYCSAISSVTFNDILERIERLISPPQNEKEAFTRDFLTNSFLIRRGNQYQFSHKSILEYLVAVKLNNEIKEGAPDIFGRCALQYVVGTFLTELSPDVDTLMGWIISTKKDPLTRGGYLGGNAATILCRMSDDALLGKDLSGANLTGANMANANLVGTNLTGANLTDANLYGAFFLKQDIEHAKMSDTTVLFCFVDPLTGSNAIRRDTVGINIRTSTRSKLHTNQQLKKYAFRLGRPYPPQANPLNKISIKIPEGETIDDVKQIFSDAYSNKLSVYYDELKRLTIVHPNLKIRGGSIIYFDSSKHS